MRGQVYIFIQFDSENYSSFCPISAKLSERNKNHDSILKGALAAKSRSGSKFCGGVMIRMFKAHVLCLL